MIIVPRRRHRLRGRRHVAAARRRRHGRWRRQQMLICSLLHVLLCGLMLMLPLPLDARKEVRSGRLRRGRGGMRNRRRTGARRSLRCCRCPVRLLPRRRQQRCTSGGGGDGLQAATRRHVGCLGGARIGGGAAAFGRWRRDTSLRVRPTCRDSLDTFQSRHHRLSALLAGRGDARVSMMVVDERGRLRPHSFHRIAAAAGRG